MIIRKNKKRKCANPDIGNEDTNPIQQKPSLIIQFREKYSQIEVEKNNKQNISRKVPLEWRRVNHSQITIQFRRRQNRNQQQKQNQNNVIVDVFVFHRIIIKILKTKLSKFYFNKYYKKTLPHLETFFLILFKSYLMKPLLLRSGLISAL